MGGSGASAARPPGSAGWSRAASRPATTAASSAVTVCRIDGPHQELLEVLRQVADDLLREVVVELLVGAAQAPDEPPDLGRRPVAEGGLDELERRRPAFGPCDDVGEDVGLERSPVGLGEEASRSRRRRTGGRPSRARRPRPTRAAARAGSSAPAGWRRRSTAVRARARRARARSAARPASRPRGGSRRGSGSRPCSAIAGQLAQEDIDRGVARRPARRHVAQHRRRRRREGRVVLAAGGDEVVQEGDPVPIVIFEPVPERPQPGAPREVGQQRRLAVAGIGEDEDRPGRGSSRSASRAADRAPASRRAAPVAGPSQAGLDTGSRRSPVAPCGADPTAADRPGPTATGSHEPPGRERQ